jgi:NADH-quinone oxidoreductase subunit H
MEQYLKDILFYRPLAARMAERNLQGWLWLLDFAYMALTAVIVLAFILLTALFLIWLERKVCGRIQRRLGPMLTGPRFLGRLCIWTGGLLQTVADTVKLLLKEDIIPSGADRLVFITAPVVVFAACMMTFVVLPFGPGLIVKDLNIGVLYLLAVGSFTVIAIVMGGYASNNKYSLLGAMRSAAQIVSYEVPLFFAFLGPVLAAGTLSMTGIVEAQVRLGWFLIPQFLGFLVYFIASTAEINRPPFDIPEAEQELVQGFNTEYSGMKFAMFFLAEFTNMFVASSIAVTLFLGGWTLPFGLSEKAAALLHFPYALQAIGVLVFLLKVYFLIFLFMWVRWSFPRLRPDQLMSFGWKVLLPASFLNVLIACVLILWRNPVS